MEGQRLTRREANKFLLGGTLAAAGLAVPGVALGQPTSSKPNQPKTPTPTKPNTVPAQPAQPPKSFLDDAMKKGKQRDWILKPTVHVQAYQEDTANAPKDRQLIIGSLSFKTAAVLFPVLKDTGTSLTNTDGLKSELTFNDRTEDVKPDFNDSYHSGVRLGRWEMRDKTGREVELKLEIPMSCWETEFDELAASKAVWPAAGKWPRMAQATFGKQAMIDVEPADAQALKDLVAKWCEGKSPQSVTPLQLAKSFAGKTVQMFQPTGNGELFDGRGSFTGLDLRGPAATIRQGSGSPHDIVSVLVGAYRAAGLPARVVIGYDETDRKGEDAPPIQVSRGGGGVNLRSWAEFCLYDETGNKELWVPVDPVRARKRSQQMPAFDKPWRYFGTHDETDTMLPFAFHFIPPTTVISYGYAFWGWFTTPSSQIGEHWLRFQAQTAPKTSQPKPPSGKKPSR